MRPGEEEITILLLGDRVLIDRDELSPALLRVLIELGVPAEETVPCVRFGVSHGTEEREKRNP